MLSAEFKVNGTVVAILNVINTGVKHENDVAYEYEYYEPSVGINRAHILSPSYMKGTAMADPNKGLRHVMASIMKSIDARTQKHDG